jgi:hypothetical protein
VAGCGEREKKERKRKKRVLGFRFWIKSKMSFETCKTVLDSNLFSSLWYFSNFFLTVIKNKKKFIFTLKCIALLKMPTPADATTLFGIKFNYYLIQFQ